MTTVMFAVRTAQRATFRVRNTGNVRMDYVVAADIAGTSLISQPFFLNPGGVADVAFDFPFPESGTYPLRAVLWGRIADAGGERVEIEKLDPASVVQVGPDGQPAGNGIGLLGIGIAAAVGLAAVAATRK